MQLYKCFFQVYFKNLKETKNARQAKGNAAQNL